LCRVSRSSRRCAAAESSHSEPCGAVTRLPRS
jgi:hypothetical protein